jgi:hypothetical protein
MEYVGKHCWASQQWHPANFVFAQVKANKKNKNDLKRALIEIAESHRTGDFGREIDTGTG